MGDGHDVNFVGGSKINFEYDHQQFNNYRNIKFSIYDFFFELFSF